MSAKYLSIDQKWCSVRADSLIWKIQCRFGNFDTQKTDFDMKNGSFNRFFRNSHTESQGSIFRKQTWYFLERAELQLTRTSKKFELNNNRYDHAEKSGNSKFNYLAIELSESFIDRGNGIYDIGEVFKDNNGDGKWTAAEEFEDLNGNSVWDSSLLIDNNLTIDNNTLAVEVASIPDQIRGVGYIKKKNIEIAKRCEDKLMSACNG